MCISLWSTKNSLGYRLILVSNRDEFYHRPSSSASWHSFEKIDQESQRFPSLPSSTSSSNQRDQQKDLRCKTDDEYKNNNDLEILSGRDLVAGGTWLGINKKQGKFGFLTNITPTLDIIIKEEQHCNEDLSRRSDLSRGNLIRNFLQGDQGVETYINTLKSSGSICKHIRGFNLVIGQLGKTIEESDQLGFFSNRDPDASYTSSFLRKDQEDDHRLDSSLQSSNNLVHGISNGIAAHSPVWLKVSLGVNLLENYLKSKLQTTDNLSEIIDQRKLEEDLFNLLSQTNDSTDYVPDNILIRPHHRLSSTESQASNETWYGTRTQTIVLVSRSTPTKVTFVERDAFHIHDKSGEPVWLGDDKSQWKRFEFLLSS